MNTEYDRLFGLEGVYTNAKANSRLKVEPPTSPYAGLVRKLHDAGIEIDAETGEVINEPYARAQRYLNIHCKAATIAEQLYNWVKGSLLTESQLGVVPPRFKTALRHIALPLEDEEKVLIDPTWPPDL